jgi:hypothetical protein
LTLFVLFLGIGDFIHETSPRFGAGEATHFVEQRIELAMTLPQIVQQAGVLVGVKKQAPILGDLVP